MNYLVYVVFHHNQDVYRELVYSLLSLDHVADSFDVRKNLRVIIYTVEEFALPFTGKIPVALNKLDKPFVENAINDANGCVFIMKTIVLNDMLKRMHESDNVILIDTDTFFRRYPMELFDKISAGHVIMHIPEQHVQKRTTIADYLLSRRFHLSDGQSYSITTDFVIWNSSVIGVNTSMISLLKDIAALIKEIAGDVNWHIIDQVAFSYFFNNYNLVPAEGTIVHYWFNKSSCYLLARYFDVYIDDEIEQWLLQYQRNIPETFSYEHIPAMAIRMLARNGYVLDTHFGDLPAGTFIGDLFRQETAGTKIITYSAPY